MRRLRLLPVATAAALVLVGLPACRRRPPSPAARCRSAGSGVLSGPPIGDSNQAGLTNREIRAMASSGVESLLGRLLLARGPPTGPGSTDFKPYDRIVGTAARNRVKLLPTVLGVPAWARVRETAPASPRASRRLRALHGRARRPLRPPRLVLEGARGNPRRPIRVAAADGRPRVYGPAAVLQAATSPWIAAARVAIRRRDPGAKGRPRRAADERAERVQLAAIYRAGGSPALRLSAVHPFTG